jgi:hypothetical protein
MAESPDCGRLMCLAAIYFSPEKTTGPRFDTLIVRGEPAKGAG